jgi:hypothetical protein
VTVSPDREISRIADRQNGNITTAQLLALGLSRPAITRWRFVRDPDRVERTLRRILEQRRRQKAA